MAQPLFHLIADDGRGFLLQHASASDGVALAASPPTPMCVSVKCATGAQAPSSGVTLRKSIGSSAWREATCASTRSSILARCRRRRFPAHLPAGCGSSTARYASRRPATRPARQAPPPPAH